ncbi:hypothetical protein ACWDSJ_26340 [Nocardia sp. NPDC003482]
MTRALTGSAAAFGAAEPRYTWLLATLCAAWHLMQQPTLAETSTTSADKRTARALARAARPAPAVTVVELRKRYRPTRAQGRSHLPPPLGRHRALAQPTPRHRPCPAQTHLDSRPPQRT